MTRAQREARLLAVAFMDYAHGAKDRDLITNEESHAVGRWIGGTDLNGKKLPPTFVPVPSAAWGRSWRETVEKIRELTRRRRRGDALEWMIAASAAAAEGFDVREPCAQLWALINADPLTELEP